MRIKELIKELKELRVKADPDNWEVSYSTLGTEDDGVKIETRMLVGSSKKIKDGIDEGDLNGNFTIYNIWDYAKVQLKVIEIENALYGYWERNRLLSLLNDDGEAVNNMNETSFKVAQARLSNPNKFYWFNEWLEDQINNIN